MIGSDRESLKSRDSIKSKEISEKQECGTPPPKPPRAYETTHEQLEVIK